MNSVGDIYNNWSQKRDAKQRTAEVDWTTCPQIIPALTGDSAERHWLRAGVGGVSPQSVSETKRRSENDEAAFEISRRDAPDPCLIT